MAPAGPPRQVVKVGGQASRWHADVEAACGHSMRRRGIAGVASFADIGEVTGDLAGPGCQMSAADGVTEAHNLQAAKTPTPWTRHVDSELLPSHFREHRAARRRLLFA
jgi:hypothetical protein